MIETLLKFAELKDLKRTGQQIYGIDDPDSVAGHSWTVAMLCLLMADEDRLDVERTLRIAVVHDLAEVETGDIASRAGKEPDISDEEKYEMEKKVMKKFSNGVDFLELWKEYEKEETPEAKFVKDMDLVERCLTALKNEKEENYDPASNDSMPFEHLDEFFKTSVGNFQTEKGKEVFNKLRNRYRRVKDDESR